MWAVGQNPPIAIWDWHQTRERSQILREKGFHSVGPQQRRRKGWRKSHAVQQWQMLMLQLGQGNSVAQAQTGDWLARWKLCQKDPVILVLTWMTHVQVQWWRLMTHWTTLAKAWPAGWEKSYFPTILYFWNHIWNFSCIHRVFAVGT